MRVADGRKLDASFALSCSQVAREMKDVALRANTISFTTVFDQASTQRAEMFHYAMRDIAEEKSETVNKDPRLLSLEDAKAATLLYPQFQPILDYWIKVFEIQRQDWPGALYGETASMKRDFVHYVLNLILLHPDFYKVASKRDFKKKFKKNVSRGFTQTLELASSPPENWFILEHSEVASIAIKS
jgi:hypothetical protein